MPTVNPNDNLGVMQKKGDHLTVSITLAIVVLLNCVGFLFPAYHASYSNSFFLIGLIVLQLFYLWRAIVLWRATFETYEGYMMLWLALSVVFIFLWIMFWGSHVYTLQLNGLQ